MREIKGRKKERGFHSISFPSEWGRLCVLGVVFLIMQRFHSISFPSEWGRLSRDRL